MFQLTGQEKMQTPPIGTHESLASHSIRAYTDLHVIVAFETRGGKILVFEKKGALQLPAESCQKNIRLFDFPDSVIENKLGLKPSQIRDEKHKFPLRILGSVSFAKSLYVFLKVPIMQVNKPGWLYINHEDLPLLEDRTEPAFFVLASKLWEYSPRTMMQ